MKMLRSAGAVLLALLAACTPYSSPGADPSASSPTSECWTSPLTGECADPNSPVMIVKIDDVADARPQFALNLADVVLVEPVEGGLTRLMAVYHSQTPVTVGPVRSARITDTDLVAAFGRPGFAYSGSTSKLVPYLQAAQLQLVGAPQGGTGYYRSELRSAPHDYLATYADLVGRLDDPVAAQLQVSSSWRIGAGSPGGKSLDGVTVQWPASEKSFTWNPAAGVWEISVFAEPLMTVTTDGGATERATAKTVFIMQTTLLDSPFRFKNGTVTPYPATIGTGKGWVLTGGRSIYGSWARPSASELPRWFDKDGLEIEVASGSVWWLIAPTSNTSVTLDLLGEPEPSPSTSE